MGEVENTLKVYLDNKINNWDYYASLLVMYRGHSTIFALNSRDANTTWRIMISRDYYWKNDCNDSLLNMIGDHIETFIRLFKQVIISLSDMHEKFCTRKKYKYMEFLY